jgi:hypothetical protein
MVFGVAAQFHSTVGCDQLYDQRLRTAPISSDINPTLGKWIRDTYPQEDLYGVGDGPVYYWKVGGQLYIASQARFREAVIIAYLNPKPSVGDVIACLGQPEAYTSGEALAPDSRGIGYSIWYPSRGVVFSYIKYDFLGIFLPVTFDANSPLDAVEVIQPMSKQEYINRVFLRDRPPETADQVRQWPIPFTRIIINNR